MFNQENIASPPPELSEEEAIPPNPDQLWAEIEALAREISEQKEKIASLENVIAAGEPEASLSTHYVCFEINDEYALEILGAILRVAKDRLKVLLLLRAQMIALFQDATSVLE